MAGETKDSLVNGNMKWIMGLVAALFMFFSGAYMNSIARSVDSLLDSRMKQDGAIQVIQTEISYIKDGVREIKDTVKELKARP